MAGELKRLDMLAECVESNEDAKALRALLQLCREQHEVLGKVGWAGRTVYDDHICLYCQHEEKGHAPDCPYSRVMAAYERMGGGT